VAPVLVRQVRNGIVESEHRGHVVEADSTGRVVRLLGDADREVTLRSTVKPFGLLALIEAGGVREFELSPQDLAVLASSHSGEDLHVRTIQSILRRARVSQTILACGTDHAPIDTLTAARLARDGERPSPIRHNCSGAHSVSILLSQLSGWPVETYWQPEHPSQEAYRSIVARVFGTKPEKLVTAVDGCGVETFAFPLRDVAKAYAFLADPPSVPASDTRASLAPALSTIRDAMVANPEMVGGTRERLDTSLMKASGGGLVSKGGAEALRGVGILPGARVGAGAQASGLAIKIEDGDEGGRAGHATAVEALRQAGALDGAKLRQLGRYHRPASLDPHGRVAAEAIAQFELAPVGELIG
jgi:L-asparaginase II